MTEKNESVFRESLLPLLGPAFSTQSPESFHAYVDALSRAVKTKQTKGKSRSMIRGRTITNPTKRAEGVYQLDCILTARSTQFKFTKTRQIMSPTLNEMASELRIDSALVEKFLHMKKFALVSSRGSL